MWGGLGCLVGRYKTGRASGDKDSHWCQAEGGYLFVWGSWEYWKDLLADEEIIPSKHIGTDCVYVLETNSSCLAIILTPLIISYYIMYKISAYVMFFSTVLHMLHILMLFGADDFNANLDMHL